MWGAREGRGERPQDRSGWAEEERTGEEAAHRKGREDGRRVEPSAGRGAKSQLVRMSGAATAFLALIGAAILPQFCHNLVVGVRLALFFSNFLVI